MFGKIGSVFHDKVTGTNQISHITNNLPVSIFIIIDVNMKLGGFVNYQTHFQQIFRNTIFVWYFTHYIVIRHSM